MNQSKRSELLRELDAMWIWDKFTLYDQLSQQTSLSEMQKFQLQYLKRYLNK